MHADGGRPAGAVGGLTDDEPGRFPRSLRKRFEARNITEPQIPIKKILVAVVVFQKTILSKHLQILTES